MKIEPNHINFIFAVFFRDKYYVNVIHKESDMPSFFVQTLLICEIVTQNKMQFDFLLGRWFEKTGAHRGNKVVIYSI